MSRNQIATKFMSSFNLRGYAVCAASLSFELEVAVVSPGLVPAV